MALSLKIVPDGATVDRWAEFVFDSPEELQVLFSGDQEGYIDAVGQLVQTIAIGGEVVGNERSGRTDVAPGLRKTLLENGRFIRAELFKDDQREARLAFAHRKLDEFWESICHELSDFDSEVSNAFLGHMRREFHYSWRTKRENWGAWYSPDEHSKELPVQVKDRILNEITSLAGQSGITDEPRDVFGNWIELSATTHYRIFMEYLYFMGSGTELDYMPALTRSALQFIKKIPDSTVTSLVLPFVALGAIKKVKRRKDLIPRVADWSTGPGRAVAEGITELQNILRSTHDSGRKKQLLSSVEKTLSSPFPRPFYIVADLLRLGSAAKKGDVDTATIEDLRKLACSETYRWLWSVRSPELKEEWRAKIRELSQAPD
jgi:hypothetical protein